MDPEAIIPILGMLCLFVFMPAIWGYSDYRVKKLKLERERVRAYGAASESELAQARSEIEDLRQRVAVLERLATDGDQQLARDIAGLGRSGSSPGV